MVEKHSLRSAASLQLQKQKQLLLQLQKPPTVASNLETDKNCKSVTTLTSYRPAEILVIWRNEIKKPKQQHLKVVVIELEDLNCTCM